MVRWWKTWVNQALDASTRLPYALVKQGQARPLTHRERRQALRRYLHKRLVLAWSGQWRLMRRQATPGQRVLVCYFGAENIGDAVMDLAGRELLAGRGWKIDLLADASVTPLFEQDEFFDQVYSDPAAIDPDRYGYAILNNLNLRTLRRKRELLPKTPFCSLVGFFYAIDYNHIELGYLAFNEIFGLALDERNLLAKARPHLSLVDSRYQRALHDLQSQLGSRPVIAIAVGGREAYRTYARWTEVFQCLDRAGEPWTGYRFILVGSDNGIADAQGVQASGYAHIDVQSWVARTNLFEVRALLACSQAFVGADGGLMHLAHTAGVPTVSLFSAPVRPEMRLTPACRSRPLEGAADINAIGPEQIVDVLREILSCPDAGATPAV
jgi:ADP-heptose:LPS heptosyltransferase